MVTERDYYEVLEVERTAGDAEIKRSFRRLAQKWHPDVNAEAGSDVRFKEINEAYQILSDPTKKQAYDMFGKAGIDGAGAGPGFGQGFGGLGDIFDAFFGGSAAGGRSEERRVGKECRSRCDWSSDVCSPICKAGIDGAGAGPGFGQGFGGLGDIFDAFFGGSAAGG